MLPCFELDGRVVGWVEAEGLVTVMLMQFVPPSLTVHQEYTNMMVGMMVTMMLEVSECNNQNGSAGKKSPNENPPPHSGFFCGTMQKIFILQGKVKGFGPK